ncbi:MAG TPA: 2-hydroxyacyl-CoA dehydratase family protein [Dictyoglomaceae bacterium]|nr:2-hydroxyacyl-CoA dehydratase family protein [Dictyoglomaceae bacterium]HOL39305.1 2-hydroxyacyl-CoA dehydratase family protein [Dictyoglomaceae bacterium]HOP95042.1 2-hydroxyacyl-CoA dehydratase family protein [Dictyoglomaceae bacterium]HPP16013.1 2-hydroxyacyl-CoA dehydratase family protein [Dictyoglomaceae bacterium]HPU42966.1 2-hydroxyacyl-CoA dehydratase family protein [Dictyoglomaceae bacterium]
MKIDNVLFDHSDNLKRYLKFPAIYPLVNALLSYKYRDDEVTKISYQYALELVRRTYGRDGKAVMVNIFTPTEFLYALDLYPMLPEVVSGFLSALDLVGRPLQESEELVSSSDLCSVHKCIIGLSKLNFLPNPDLLISVNKPCHSAIYSFYLLNQMYGGSYYPLDSYERVDFLAGKLEKIYNELSMKLRIQDADLKLKKAIDLSNEAREYLLEINELRKEALVIGGKEFLDYAGMIFSAFGSKYGVVFFKALRDKIKDLIKKGKIIEPKIRLYWMHLGPYFRTDFFDWMKSKGAYIVFEESSFITWEKLDPNNPFESLAKKMLNLKAFSTLEERYDVAVKNVEEYKADGVVIFNQWGCRQGSVPSYFLRKKLVNGGIPAIVIDGDLIDKTNFPKEQIKTRMEAFFEVIA